MTLLNLLCDADIEGLSQLSANQLLEWRAQKRILAVCGAGEQDSNGLYTKASDCLFAHVARPWILHRLSSGCWQLDAVLRSREGRMPVPYYCCPDRGPIPPIRGWMPVAAWEAVPPGPRVISLEPQCTALHLAAALGFESALWTLMVNAPLLCSICDGAGQTAAQIAQICGYGKLAKRVCREYRWQWWRLLLKARRDCSCQVPLDPFARRLCVLQDELWRRVLDFV